MPSVDPDIALKLTVKAMNDTLNSEGLVPSILVFGLLTRFLPTSNSLLSHADRMEAMEIARLEMTGITAQLRIRQTLRSKLQPATKYHVEPGDQVYVHHEREGKSCGPHKVLRTFEKQFYVDRDGKESQYSLDHILPASTADYSALINHVHTCLTTDRRRKAPSSF